jgi:hypothetical protein
MADVQKLDPAFEKRRRSKNLAIALTIAGCCVLFYAITVVKMIR